MKEHSLVLIKPDAVEENLIGEIISYYEKANLKIADMKMVRVSEDLASKHYEEHKEKTFYKDLINYLQRSPVVAMIIEGEDAVNRIRTINGNTNPKKAEKGTIREKFGKDVGENCVHASDCVQSAKREIELWFSGN